MRKNLALILLVISLSSFEGIITQAHGGNGVFSGKCIMRVSNFNILLKSHFDDISINQSYQVTQGTVIADRGPGIMINLDDLIPAIDSIANIPVDSIIAHIDEYTDVADSLVYEIDPAIVTDSLETVLENLQDQLNEVVADSAFTTLTEQQQNEIQNLIDHIESLLNQTIEGTDNPTFVMFKEFPEQTYGFDEPDSSLTSLYQYYVPPNNVGGTEQFIRWKSITAGGIDKIYARLDSANTTIKFYNEANNLITPTEESTDTLKILQLTGGIAETTSIIRAEININDSTTQVVGMLNLVTYLPKTTNLVVVPVNGNALPGNLSTAEFKAQLDKIYGVAAMSWDITLEQNITFDYASVDGNETFNAWPQGGEIYTSDMNGIIAQLYTQNIYDPDKYYLFLVDNPEVNGQLGIMPFSQQYAFVFVDKFNNDERFKKTTAHELAHGIFNLEHQYKFHAGIDTFATANLMTYHPTATNLNKYQWDRVQNPLDRGYHDAGDAGQIENIFVYSERIIELLRLMRFSYKQNIPVRLCQTPISEKNIKVGNNTYSKIGCYTNPRCNGFNNINVKEVEFVKDYRTLYGEDYFILRFDNFELNFSDNEDRDKMIAFIKGEEDNIYGSNNKDIILNNKTINFNYIIQNVEKRYIKLLKNNKYYNLTKAEKTILDLPIIEWKLGYYYGASLMDHWFEGSGKNVKLSQTNVNELLLSNNSVFKNHLENAKQNFRNNLFAYPSNFEKICDTILVTKSRNYNIINTSLSQNYKENKLPPNPNFPPYNPDKHLFNPNKILTYVIKESNVVNEIDNDFVASIGSVSIGFYFDENINLLGGGNGKVLATKIYWRIWDSFNFIDDHNWYSFFIKSQPLGNWQREIFKQNPTSPSIGFGLVNNNFINIYKKIHEIDISSKKSNQKPNFSIITEYQKINNDLWVVSFYRYITGGCKCQIFKYE